MLFTIKELAEHFGQNEQWIYNRVYELGIQPISKIPSQNGIGDMNLYNADQKEAIAIYLKRRVKNVIVIENNYHIYQSKINTTELEQL
ncbi:hypothetical protein [Flavobacterium sp. 25HG05S-40]|uniref:hypothetical protein n=1 Tax=Flavobacterium sp. 25HG05S-40 TaxID=3458682 RepID=UPI004043951E